LLADQDPYDAADGIEFLGTTLSWPLFQDLFGYVGSQCGLGSSFDDDLEAVQRLTDDEVGDLLVVLLHLLQAFEEGQSDRIPELADVLTAIHDRELSHPIEEAFRDLLDTAFVDSLVAAVPLLLEPSSHYSADFSTADAFVFDALWDLLVAAADPSDNAPLSVLRPVVAAVGEQTGLWTSLAHFGTLAAEPEAEIQNLLSVLCDLPESNEADPADVGFVLLDDPDWLHDILLVAETSAITDALVQTDESSEGALPFGARLVTNGTIDRLLRTLQLALDAMR
jgi:hypothetical protein